jgi:ribA/ribD-fused uncharacterized protein
MSEQFTYFWGEAPFSQWCPATFTIDGIVYCCSEQWMMACKARMFNDDESLAKIMAATHPRDQKKLGRQVEGFVVDQWNAAAQDLVYAGNRAKFTQNPDMLDVLMETAGTTLVEASPYDRIWGIGMYDHEAKKCGRAGWRGLNGFGKVFLQFFVDFSRFRSNPELCPFCGSTNDFGIVGDAIKVEEIPQKRK